MGLHGPPLTPSHSNSAGSDDFNTTSPPVRLPARIIGPRQRGLHGRRKRQCQEQKHQPISVQIWATRLRGASPRPFIVGRGICGLASHFTSRTELGWMTEADRFVPQDVYDHQFANGGIPHDGIPHEQYAAFDGFSAPFGHQQNAFPGPPTPPNPQLVPNTRSLSNPQITLAPAPASAPAPFDRFALSKREIEDQAQSRRQGSNSDDDDLTPAQSRRKAQNRAAYVTPLFPELCGGGCQLSLPRRCG